MPRSKAGRRRRPAKAVKSASIRTDNDSDAILGAVGLTELRRLIRLVQKTGIGELEVSSGQKTVRISAPVGSPPTPVWALAGAGTGGAAPAATPAEPAAAKPDGRVAITSPMVGTFYRAPAPDADPYVEVGDAVEVGQTVCIVEAMKLMNEIEAEVKGRIVEILVQNAQPVEFGQKLFLVEPA
jgi:oxaloacetate decarboxylase alpha subunit